MTAAALANMRDDKTAATETLSRKDRAEMIWAVLKSYMLDECSLECAAVGPADDKYLVNAIFNSLPEPAPARCDVQISDDMVQEACDVYSAVYADDDKDMGDAMRAALKAALALPSADTTAPDDKRALEDMTLASNARKAAIEECARHLEREADVATNSLHCGDNSGTIAAVHRVSRTYHEAVKSLRAIKTDGIRTEASPVPSADRGRE